MPGLLSSRGIIGVVASGRIALDALVPTMKLLDFSPRYSNSEGSEFGIFTAFKLVFDKNIDPATVIDANIIILNFNNPLTMNSIVVAGNVVTAGVNGQQPVILPWQVSLTLGLKALTGESLAEQFIGSGRGGPTVFVAGYNLSPSNGGSPNPGYDISAVPSGADKILTVVISFDAAQPVFPATVGINPATIIPGTTIILERETAIGSGVYLPPQLMTVVSVVGFVATLSATLLASAASGFAFKFTLTTGVQDLSGRAVGQNHVFTGVV